ncbi:hypothetical protein BH20ACT17_BH20ACT17_15570 [soil metagenome]
MAAIPELRGMSAKWMECAKALAVVEKDLSALLAKQAKSSSPVVENVSAWSEPQTRQRSGGVPPPPPVPAAAVS